MKKRFLFFVCVLLSIGDLFSIELKRNEYMGVNYQTYSPQKENLYYNENGYLIWKEGSWYAGKLYDAIIIDGKYDYRLVETPFMKAEDFSYSTVKSNSDAYEMYKRGCPCLLSFVDNIKASSTLKDKNYSYDIENVTLPSRENCYVQNLPWAEGKADEGIGESIEFDIMSVYHAYSDGAGRKEIRGNIQVSILNGFVNPYKQSFFYENNRIKKASIYVDGQKYMDLKFNDFVEFTEFEIPSDSKHVKIVIDEVYKGTKYNDTCITKIDVFYSMSFLD
jgi:hypothetical protein